MQNYRDGKPSAYEGHLVYCWAFLHSRCAIYGFR